MVQISDTAFAEQVKSFLEDREWSMSTLARSAGISKATLSQYMSASYPGDVDKIRTKLSGVMTRENDKLSEPVRVMGFVETSVSTRVFKIAHSCHIYCEIGVCYSAAGLGKTESVREYARQNPDVILIEADPGYTAKILFQELRDSVGGSSRTNLHDIFVDCCQRLKNSGRLLIIDEAEQLPYKALEMLRRLHDKTGIGILLVGMPRLISNLSGMKGEYAQLYSRVGIATKLLPITEKDASNIIDVMLPGCSDKIKGAFYKEVAGNTRRLCKMITRSQAIAHKNKMDVSEDVIRRAAGLVKLEVMS